MLVNVEQNPLRILMLSPSTYRTMLKLFSLETSAVRSIESSLVSSQILARTVSKQSPRPYRCPCNSTLSQPPQQPRAGTAVKYPPRSYLSRRRSSGRRFSRSYHGRQTVNYSVGLDVENTFLIERIRPNSIASTRPRVLPNPAPLPSTLS